jgi:hypothetical protein
VKQPLGELKGGVTEEVPPGAPQNRNRIHRFYRGI